MSEPSKLIAPIDILLVDDDEGDILLMRKALEGGRFLNTLNVARDGVEALEYLRREGSFRDATCPDLILLDLNMPRMNGRETLAAIKDDPKLKVIPVVVLTTSDADMDVTESYDLQASCFINKSVGFKQFTEAMHSLTDYWASVVKLPPKG